MKIYLLFGLLSLLPIVLWIWFFQKQNYEKTRYVWLSFLAGILSVIPIKLYEKYWHISFFFFEHLNLFQYLADVLESPRLPEILSFIAVGAIVSTALFLFSGLVMFFIEVLSGDNTVKVFKHKLKKIGESPFLFVAVGILMGFLAAWLSQILDERIWFFVVVGMLEEFVKYLFLRFSDEDKINSISDAISFSILIALGFAFVENILYLYKFWDTMGQNVAQFMLFFVLRSTLSVLAHICFSAILGYFYGVAHFSEEIYRVESRKNKHPLLKWFHRILHVKGSTLFHEEKLMEGFLLAMITHAIFNSLLEFGHLALIVPFLLILFFVVLQLLHLKRTHVRLGNLFLHRNLQKK